MDWQEQLFHKLLEFIDAVDVGWTASKCWIWPRAAVMSAHVASSRKELFRRKTPQNAHVSRARRKVKSPPLPLIHMGSLVRTIFIVCQL